MDNFSDLDDEQLTRLHDEFEARDEALWKVAMKMQRKNKARELFISWQLSWQ